MRYAIISDIHSNLEALEAVLAEITKKNVDKILCLGDIVGYGPNPNECIKLVRKNCDVIITGNHDYACKEKSELIYFNRFAKQAIMWTLTVISEKNLDFISALQINTVVDGFNLVHANPFSPETWDYVLSIDEAIYSFSRFNGGICFIGHSHQPRIYIENSQQKYSCKEDNNVHINADSRYIINVGSVGQPRDNNPAAAAAIFDSELKTYELVRIGYNVEKTYQKMISSGLPEFLADRLLTGT